MTYKPIASCAGRLDKRVTLERFDNTIQNAHGQPDKEDDKNWQQVASVAASVKTQTGREFYSSDQTQATVTHQWMVRYSKSLADITPEWRLKHGSHVYNIVSAFNINEAGEYIMIRTARKY